MPKNLDTIGNHLKAKRLKGNETQPFVALLLGVDVKTINNWERNKTRIIAAKYYPKIMEFLTYCPMQKQPTTFAEKIKLHRLYKGLNQKQFTQLLKVDPTTVRFWENGKRKPLNKTINKIKTYNNSNHKQTKKIPYFYAKTHNNYQFLRIVRMLFINTVDCLFFPHITLKRNKPEIFF
jgi:transcriptional regulator with XRE-family HTH domain